MMQFWLTRFTKPASQAPGFAASFVVHALLVSAAVVATRPDPSAPERPLHPNSIVRFLAPPNRTAGQEMRVEQIRWVALAVPADIGADAVEEVVVQAAEARVSGLDPVDSPALEELAGLDSVFSLVEVDSAASRYEWSAAPAFPPTMLAQRQSGFVNAEWVVDELGRADTATLRIIESTHPDFTKAVRDALPFMRFQPARIGRRVVRQLVQQPFYFQVTTAAADTATPRKPSR